jgi:GDP-L-fucose synthase
VGGNGLDRSICLVTGATGLIGRQVVSRLLALGKTVVSVSLDEISLPGVAEHVVGDLRDYSLCLGLTRDVDEVYHLAGIKGSLEVTKTRPASFLAPMLQLNTNLLEAAAQNRVPRLVYTSSIGAYASSEVFREEEGHVGDPMDTYPGWAKRIAELQVRACSEEYGIDWAIVRPCNVYGPGDNFDPANAMVIPSLMMKIKRGDNPVEVWGDGTAIRDFAFSGDVADGILLAAANGTRGSFVNLGSGVGYSVGELVSTLQEFLDFEVEFNPSRSSGFTKRVMDISRARDWLGFEPGTSLREGLEETWAWFLENGDEYLKRKNYFVKTSGSSERRL